MAIAERPIKKDQPAAKTVPNEKKIEALINKGGSTTRPRDLSSVDDDEQKSIRLIPYVSQLNEIEELISQMPKRGRLSRHAWILQAIDEKIQRDKKKRK